MKALSVVCLFLKLSAFVAYEQSAGIPYLSNFPSIISASYTAAGDAQLNGLLGGCKNAGPLIEGEITVVSDDSFITAGEVQQQCDTSKVCIIPSGVTLEMTESLQVGALRIQGRLEWTDSTQVDEEIYLCAGYVVTEESAEFYMNLSWKKAWIYIQDNGARHEMLMTRAFGGYLSTVEVIGRRLERTWSLLDRPFSVSDTSLKLLHDPALMGWQVGDRIGIAPTEAASKGQGQSFRITDIWSDGTILVDAPSAYDHQADFRPTTGDQQAPILMSAEVVNLSRNIIITGDDFQHVPCDPSVTDDTKGCMCSPFRTTCTLGLHTMQAHDGTMRISGTRVEKCGQRGIQGKYCLHFHQLNDCPDCLFDGNAIETSQFRGIIVHGTHRSIVENNVMWDVRGAGVYVEDGNEMHNQIKYNVYICPWPLQDPIQNGCTIPGTNNDQSDTSLNHSAFYMKSGTNDLIGNRAANSYNGMMFDPGALDGEAVGRVCGGKTGLGRWVGNTFHGHGRFGTYTINGPYPRITDQSLATNGFNLDMSLCDGFDDEGRTRGFPASIVGNLDYGNVFVGHYVAGK
jgi:hypothetical protein